MFYDDPNDSEYYTYRYIEPCLHPAAAEVLTLVAATAPLSKPNARRLRLVCRSTKASIDEHITKLRVPLESLDALRTEDNPLTAGLTSLRFFEEDVEGQFDMNKTVPRYGL